MKVLRKLLLSFAVMVCGAQLSVAQQLAVEEQVLNSNALDEEQKFTVYLPENYDSDADHRYPVLYALDGKYYKNMVSAVIAQFYADGLIPDTILVTIDNEDRIRDYTPSPHATVDVESGEADKFLDYIEKELIPFVDSNYKTSDFKILQGHSLGGLFSLYAVQARPELFTAHYAFSPSLHWGDNATVKNIKEYISSRKTLNQFIYMSLGDEVIVSEYTTRNTMRNSFLELKGFFEGKSIPGLRVKSEVFPTLPHVATNITGLVNATNALYRNWVLSFPAMEKGPEGISEHYKKLSSDLYYEVKPRIGSLNFAADYLTNGVKQPEKGMAILNYNASLYPDSAQVKFLLAKAYKSCGDKVRARRFSEEALVLIKEDVALKASINEFLDTL
jgi:predicted alpha/beta superfamily hydrolase